MIILTALVIAALVFATFSATFCRGATVSDTYGRETPAPIDFGDTDVSFIPTSAKLVQVRIVASYACALIMSVHTVADNCLVRLYTNDQTNTVEATSIEWSAKQSKTDLTESQCEQKAEAWIVSGDNE